MKNTNFIMTLLLTAITLTACGSMGSSPSTAYAAPGESTMALNNPSLFQKSSNATWQTLQHTPLPRLQEAEAKNPDPTAKGWISLAAISKEYSTNTPELIQALQNWRAQYPSHPGNALLPGSSTLDQLMAEHPPRHIALLLPLQGPMASSGQTVRSGFMSAYYENIGKTPEKQAVSFYDTNETSDIGALYKKAIDEGADMVIGPLTKPQVEALIQVNQFNVRVLALNYTQPSFFKSLPNNFYEFGLSPASEAEQVGAKARQAGLSNALIIATDDAWGHRVADALKAEWQGAGGKITDSLYFTANANLTSDVANLLHVNPKKDTELTRKDNSKAVLAEQRRQDFDVIFVFAQPDTGRQIVPLLRFYYAGNVPVYSISSIYSGRPNPGKDRDLNGVTFSEIPWIIEKAHAGAATPVQYDRLYAIGRDAYLLSQALPRLNSMPNFPVYGATGALELSQQQIHQRLPAVKMHGGQI